MTQKNKVYYLKDYTNQVRKERTGFQTLLYYGLKAADVLSGVFIAVCFCLSTLIFFAIM